MPKVAGYHDEDARLRREEMGRRIEFARNKMKMSKSEFAALVGVGPSSYTAWINGKSSPTVHSLAKLCEVSGVPSSFFNPERLSDIREVDRFAHELVARLGVDQVRDMLALTDEELAAQASGSVPTHGQLVLEQINKQFTPEQIQDVIMQLLLGLETGMLQTLLDSNRSVLFSVALATGIDVENLDAQSRTLLRDALASAANDS